LLPKIKTDPYISQEIYKIHRKWTQKQNGNPRNGKPWETGNIQYWGAPDIPGKQGKQLWHSFGKSGCSIKSPASIDYCKDFLQRGIPT